MANKGYILVTPIVEEKIQPINKNETGVADSIAASRLYHTHTHFTREYYDQILIGLVIKL